MRKGANLVAKNKIDRNDAFPFMLLPVEQLLRAL
jgi:hypothetical protein